MHKMDIGRVIIAGLVAGIVSDALGYLVDGILLQARWSDGMAKLGLTDFDQNEWIWFSAIGLSVALS